MILVTINEAKFEYDIHSLFKAFFPEDEVKVSLPAYNESLEYRYSFNIDFTPESIIFRKNQEILSSGQIDKDTLKTEQKNILKRSIYSGLVKLTGHDLVWGNLTGIRPTKIPMKLLDEGMTEDYILRYMKDTYLISDEKGCLAIDIAKREKRVLSDIHYKNGYSIYIGIPFCPTTCLYCSFTSFPIGMWRNRVEEYLKALVKELHFTAQNREGQILDTIYIGGGTPTTLEPQELDFLLGNISKIFDLSHLLEYTVEAGRADSITPEKLAVLRKYGVNRISVNPQTMNDETLGIIGRRHTTEDVERAFYQAREAGFTNINMDIILGLPGEDESHVHHTVERIKNLMPDSLTVHSLAVKRASKLAQMIHEKGYITMNNTDETMMIAMNAAKEMDMNPYYLYRQKNMAGNFENVGYAKEGCYGIYNILIMEELQPIIAHGPGSVSKIITPGQTLERCDNVKDVALYIDKIDEMIERKKQLFELEK